MAPPEESALKATLDVLVAVGTLAAVWVAIWGDQIKLWLFEPKLEISLLDEVGELNPDQAGNPLLVFHLRVRNMKPKYPAKGCEAFVVEVWRKTPTDLFAKTVMVVPRSLSWSPRELKPLSVTIGDEALLDFGCLQGTPVLLSSSNCFFPWLVNFPHNFNGFVSAGETVRYVVEVRADNMRSSARATIEVSWNGKWAKTAEEMKKHISVRRLAHVAA